jgi:hypothetical protein
MMRPLLQESPVPWEHYNFDLRIVWMPICVTLTLNYKNFNTFGTSTKLLLLTERSNCNSQRINK